MNAVEQAAISELPSVLHRSSRRAPLLFGLAVLVIGLCGAGAYLWTTLGMVLEVPAPNEAAQTLGLSAEDRATLSDMQSELQKTSTELMELSRGLDVQQADLKRISDQIAVLTSRIEAAQNAPATPPVPTAALPTAPSSPHPGTKPVKRVGRSPKSEGPMSVGGAPLVLEPSTQR
ncbi:hypothetical protein I6F35_21660 [Bradyrhizobium sp. BRP22]|uniref:hypothetical protein n=1 Tax=Bradyrhizobium sp. BRP22 TaxID=2793821 RepID=UPI001CD2C259|nr:hypothetical protein [Bradyrhizobium sp. BRP22]MCA1455788.1 hypothetical protein [Bradyrhizobium sp. BRP22]